jgi:predicted regulator of Ras-like GTPase activity (Roadblock/LC7/MglB family)
MDEQLLGVLNYEGVLGVVVTTLDGLVIAASGVDHADAEVVGAAGSSLVRLPATDDESDVRSIEAAGGMLHVLPGNDLTLILLTESSIPSEAVRHPMEETLKRVSEVMQ